MPLPAFSSINVIATTLTVGAAILMLRFKLGLVTTMGVMALAGMALSLL
jgi:hypothetical protein